jgi:tetratricopeptide (TPR) repeat protein
MPEVQALNSDDFDQGVEAFRLNKFTKAAACFKRALPHRTTDPRIYAYLGTIAVEQDNIVDAYGHYQALDQLIVSPQHVRLALAVLASRLGDQQASLRYLERAAAPDAEQMKAGLSGQDEYDLLDIALAIYKDGSSQGFIALRQIVQDANPKLHAALEAVISGCRGLEGEEFIAQFSLRLLDQLPDHEFTPVLAAKWLSTLGRIDRVNQSLLSLVQADPGRHRCWVALGYLATASQNLQMAVRCYRQAIALTPSVDVLYHTLADLLMRTGEFDEAEALIDKGLVAAKQKRSLKLLKVSLYNAQGLYDEALCLAQQITTENESLDEAWIVLAELFCARGFFGAAAALIQGIKDREVD